MEKISNQQNDQLLDFLDGKLSGAEVAVLKTQLEQSPAMRERLEDLRLIHDLLSSRSVVKSSLSPAFTNNVMYNLDKAPSTSSLSPRNGLLLLIGILVATGVGMFLLATGSLDSLSGLVNLNELNLPKALQNFSIKSIPLSIKTVMKVVIMINLVIAFIVLDRTVLKPFFNRKQSTEGFN